MKMNKLALIIALSAASAGALANSNWSNTTGQSVTTFNGTGATDFHSETRTISRDGTGQGSGQKQEAHRFDNAVTDYRVQGTSTSQYNDVTRVADYVGSYDYGTDFTTTISNVVANTVADFSESGNVLTWNYDDQNNYAASYVQYTTGGNSDIRTKTRAYEETYSGYEGYNYK